MGQQNKLGKHVIELRAESVILYDNNFFSRNKDGNIYANGATKIQSVELTKEYLSEIIKFFDNPENRRTFEI